MSGLTTTLLGGRPSERRSGRWLVLFHQIATRLTNCYGTPTLGDLADPVQEIFYILLSSKTSDGQYRRTYAALAARFPRLIDLAEASLRDIRACIHTGGLARAKANRLKRIARILVKLGPDPSESLRSMSAPNVYSFLTALPGVGPKSALCVMMCSLNHDVLPVDVNMSRIAVRVGAVPPELKHYRYQQLLPRLTPDGRSKELHVAMVVHGRTMCVPRSPKCGACPIRDLCRFGQKRLRGEAERRHTKEIHRGSA